VSWRSAPWARQDAASIGGQPWAPILSFALLHRGASTRGGIERPAATMCGFLAITVGRANLINGCPEDGSSVHTLAPAGWHPGMSANRAAIFSWRGAGARLPRQQSRLGRVAVRGVGHPGLAPSSGDTATSPCRSQLRNHAGLASPAAPGAPVKSRGRRQLDNVTLVLRYVLFITCRHSFDDAGY